MDRLEGIVMKKSDYQESDRILSIYTKELGRVEFLVKGGRKTLAKIAPHLELFNHVKIDYVQGKNFKIITGAEILNSFLGLRTNFDKIEAGYKITRLFDQFIIGQESDIDLFNLLLKTLERLNKNALTDQKSFEKSFASNFSKIIGYGIII